MEVVRCSLVFNLILVFVHISVTSFCLCVRMCVHVSVSPSHPPFLDKILKASFPKVWFRPFEKEWAKTIEKMQARRPGNRPKKNISADRFHQLISAIPPVSPYPVAFFSFVTIDPLLPPSLLLSVATACKEAEGCSRPLPPPLLPLLVFERGGGAQGAHSIPHVCARTWR